MRDRALEVLADDLRRLLERGKRRQLTALERLEVQRLEPAAYHGGCAPSEGRSRACPGDGRQLIRVQPSIDPRVGPTAHDCTTAAIAEWHQSRRVRDA